MGMGKGNEDISLKINHMGKATQIIQSCEKPTTKEMQQTKSEPEIKKKKKKTFKRTLVPEVANSRTEAKIKKKKESNNDNKHLWKIVREIYSLA